MHVSRADKGDRQVSQPGASGIFFFAIVRRVPRFLGERIAYGNEVRFGSDGQSWADGYREMETWQGIPIDLSRHQMRIRDDACGPLLEGFGAEERVVDSSSCSFPSWFVPQRA
jgi:hypothetical protein